MKLLFNLDGQGTAEIKKILGFTDADLKWEKLEPFVIPATDRMIDIIGRPIYDSLVGIYEADSASLQDAEFLLRVQHPVLLDAYRHFAKENDIAHTPNGRVNRINDKQKIAFEWQIERSDRSLERNFYQLVDRMLEFMDKNIVAWLGTDAYKATRELFVPTAKDFDVHFHINSSRLLFIMLAPGQRNAEIEEIVPRIKKSRADELKASLLSNDPDIDRKLVSIIRKALVYATLSWAIPRMSAQLFPEGLLEVADTSRLSVAARKATERNQAESLSQLFARDAAKAYIELEDYIKSLDAPPPGEILPIKPCFNRDDKFVDT